VILEINGFVSIVSVANSLLLDRAPSTIFYSNTTDLSENAIQNEALIRQEVGDGANIYAIWSRASNDDRWMVKYIGQRSRGKVIERIKQHLFRTPSGTNSKLQKVKELVIANNQIGISTVLVLPDRMRLSIEEQLIFDNTNTENDLPWNNRSRNVRLPGTSQGG